MGNRNSYNKYVKEKQLTKMGKRNSLQRWERETTNKDGKEKQL